MEGDDHIIDNAPEGKEDESGNKPELSSPHHEETFSPNNDTNKMEAEENPNEMNDSSGECNLSEDGHDSVSIEVAESHVSEEVTENKELVKSPDSKDENIIEKEGISTYEVHPAIDVQPDSRDDIDEGGYMCRENKSYSKSQASQTTIQLVESSIFRDFSLDVATMQVEIGLMTVDSLEDLDPEIEDWPLLLVSQLRLRDNMINTLNGMLTEVLEKGRRLEEDVDYLKLKILDLKQQVKRNKKNKKAFGSQTTEEDFAVAWSKWYSESYHYYCQGNTGGGYDMQWEYVQQPAIKESVKVPILSKSESALQDEHKTNSEIQSDNGALKTVGEECCGGRKVSAEKVEKDSEEGDDGGPQHESSSSPQSKAKSNTQDDDYSYSNNNDGKNKDSLVSQEPSVSENLESVGEECQTTKCEDDTGHGWDNSGGMSIVDQVKAAATEAVHGSGYVFQEELGLYYDYNTQYYYNAETGLYYDSKTGTYFYYDHATQAYQFHSQVPVDEAMLVKAKRKDNADRHDAEGRQSKRTKKSKAIAEEDKEEGECSDSEEEESNDEEEVNKKETAEEEVEREETVYIPPSLRLMVIESSSERVKVGTLHLVTLDGGTVGREAKNLVQLPDLNISKIHAEISYYSGGPDDHHYYLKDLGSNNGTFVNEARLSEPRETSQEVEIGHGWMLQFGPVKVKCHIHPGLLTCNECEPGLVSASNSADSKSSIASYKNAKTREKARKKELQAMKKKYALTSSATVPHLGAEYNDRADQRRKKVGSDNPYEKTEVASTEVALRENNKGFALLQKMGWSEGQSLGKTQKGLTQPIQPRSIVGRGGLGSATAEIVPTTADKKRKKVLQITKERYNQT